tara:strand:- start:230 stop:598 length:369 start_codon:yes stop_codon:yes gene_type:complete
MSQEWSNILNRMSKPELLELAREYNRSFDKIENVAKLKKAELKVELLMREKKAKKIWSGQKKVKPAKTRKRTIKKLSKEDADDLIEQSIKLGEEAMKTKDIALKTKLLQEIEKIQKKLSKGL